MQTWTDIDMVNGILRHDEKLMERCYTDCRRYFNQHAAAIFVDDADAHDIFQDAMIHLWREIETRRIEVFEGRVCRWADGQLIPMRSSLMTFLMAVAKRKNWEHVRQQQRWQLTNNDRVLETLDNNRYDKQTDDVSETELRERVVTDAVLAMTERCRQILTLFYYEHRSLDEILALRPENNTKMGLKTSKYKCMQRLRERVHQRFQQLKISL